MGGWHCQATEGRGISSTQTLGSCAGCTRTGEIKSVKRGNSVCLCVNDGMREKEKETDTIPQREGGAETFWRATTAAQRSLTAAHSLVHLCMFYFVFWATTTQSQSWWDASTTMHAMLNAQQKGHFHKHGGVFRFNTSNCWLRVQVLRSTESSCWNDSTVLPPTW